MSERMNLNNWNILKFDRIILFIEQYKVLWVFQRNYESLVWWTSNIISAYRPHGWEKWLMSCKILASSALWLLQLKVYKRKTNEHRIGSNTCFFKICFYHSIKRYFLHMNSFISCMVIATGHCYKTTWSPLPK